jgi:hypothetical protein
VAIAQFFCAVFEEANQSPVDVPESQEGEVVSTDETSLGLKPVSFTTANAALERRSSILFHLAYAEAGLGLCEGKMRLR